MSSTPDKDKTLDRAANLLAVFAGLMAARFGWSIGHDTADSAIFAGVFALGAYFSLTLLDIGLIHLRAGRTERGWLALGTWGFVIALEIIGHTGFSATNRSADIQAASLQTVSYEDTRATVADLEKQVAKLESQDQWAGRPIEAVEADLQVLTAGAVYAGTKGCTQITSKAERRACNKWRDLSAEKANAAEAAAIRAELADARKKLTDIRGAKVDGEAMVSAASSQAKTLASLATWQREPTADAIYWTTVLMSMATALFMVLSGVIKAVSNLGDAAREALSGLEGIAKPRTLAEAPKTLTDTLARLVAISPVAPAAPMQGQTIRLAS